ncbi:MAG TPA: riboflavin synthase [Candidatus Rubrimentiphilum sp.]|nr:riboflavin synthase [Candidatus Rubrimentiphilum sp.]
MFSGIISYSGTVEDVQPAAPGGLRLRVRCENASDEEIEPKDSIAINGVCLTVTAIDHNVVDFDVVPETLARSALSGAHKGEKVNVEYALRAGDRMGGHFVYGHVDAAGKVLAQTPEGQGARLRIELPENLRRFVREKGFVSVDGVSVTVAAVGDKWFEVALIPETMGRTTLGRRTPGELVNLEADPIARYAVQP